MIVACSVVLVIMLELVVPEVKLSVIGGWFVDVAVDIVDENGVCVVNVVEEIVVSADVVAVVVTVVVAVVVVDD